MLTEDITKLKIDVLIPTHQPGGIFSELLKRLDAQSIRPAHVRVINTEASYWESRFEQDFPGLLVSHIKKQEFDHGGTRNLMAQESDADLLLFMTQDALPADRRLIENLASQFVQQTACKGEQSEGDTGQPEQSGGDIGQTDQTAENAGQPDQPAGDTGQPDQMAGNTGHQEAFRVAAAYARQLPRLDCSTLEKYTRSFNYPKVSRVKTKADLDTLGIKTFFCSNVCAMYDREIYMECGGFPLHTIFNEDMIFARKLIDAGFGIAYAADARVVHSHNYTGGQQFHRNFDLAVSQAQYPEVFADVPAEGEGFRMIRQVAGQLCRTGRPWLVFPLIWQSGCKYLGYLLGKRYRRIPKKFVRKFSQNKSFWKVE